MYPESILEMSVGDWERWFSDRYNTKEIPRLGGAISSYFKEGIWNQCFSPEQRLLVYPAMVQATLNKWSVWSAVKREAYEMCPINMVAHMSFSKDWILHENLRQYYERLWLESPRPHTTPLLHIAISSKNNLPISRAEIGLLYETEGWSAVAVRIAFNKGFAADAEEMFRELNEKSCTVWNIDDLVDLGLPKEAAIQVLRLFQSDRESADELISYLESL